MKSVYAANPVRHKSGAFISGKIRPPFHVRPQRRDGRSGALHCGANLRINRTRSSTFQWISLM
jgi:hypothetical protein